MVDLVRPAYEEARRGADVVILTPHWGANGTENPTRGRIALARQLIELGFDAILGHSAHQIHGMELHQGRPILYDMGNFIADWVGDERMSQGGLFELEIDHRGVSSLRLVPLRIRPGRVQLATGRPAEKTRRLFRRLTRELDERLRFEQEGEELVTIFEPPPRLREALQSPARVHSAGSTTRLPEEWSKARDVTVVDSPPAYTEGFEPISLEKGVDIIGVKTVEAVRLGSCFLVEVALKVREPLAGFWDAVVISRRTDGEGEMRYQHPISNGGTDPAQWEPGQIVLDRICVRQREGATAGRWDLYWALHERSSKKLVNVRSFPRQTAAGYAKIGTIRILAKGVDRRAAGIDWDGRLPTELR